MLRLKCKEFFKKVKIEYYFMFYVSFRVFYWYFGVEIICYFLLLIVVLLFFLFIFILIEFYKNIKLDIL